MEYKRKEEVKEKRKVEEATEVERLRLKNMEEGKGKGSNPKKMTKYSIKEKIDQAVSIQRKFQLSMEH
jgi:hypothetical protein